MKKLFIALFLLCFTIPSICFAETWELAIQPWDKADLASGHKRAKAGDIVAVKPYPWNWGTIELQNYLIIIVDNLTKEEALQIVEPLYLGDNSSTRKFKIDIGKLKTNILPILDESKLADQSKTENYQPFKDAGVRISADMLKADLMQNKYDLKYPQR